MNSAAPQLLFVRRCLRVIWVLLGAGLLGWIVMRNLPLSGKLSASARTAEPSGFVGGFTPQDRAVPVQEDGVWYSDIVNEPVYLNLAAPRLYDRMRVKLRYKEEGQPYLALGARTDLKAWNFDLKSIDLPMLDEAGWSARQDGEYRIYERRGTSRTAAEILTSDSDRAAVLSVDPVRWGLRLPALRNERPVDAIVDDPAIRHVYVYVQDGPFEATLGLRGPAASAASVILVHRGKALLMRTHQGDGAVELTLTGAEPGLYRIDIDAAPDVALIGLRTRHGRVAFVAADGQHLKIPAGASAFSPEFPVVTWETDLKKASYDTIVARYSPPIVEADGWRTAEAEYDLRTLAASQGRVQMVFSAPAIKQVGGRIRVDRVDVEYLRPPLTLKALIDLIKSKL